MTTDLSPGKKSLIGIALCAIITTTAFSQSFKPLAAIPRGISGSIKYFIKTDQGGVHLPFSGRKELSTLTILGFTALFISRLDREVDEEYGLETHPFPFSMVGSFGKAGKLYDSKYTLFLLGGATASALGYSYLSKNETPRSVIVQMWQAYAVCSAVTILLKTAIGRHRPYTNQGPYQFTPFDLSFNSEHMSFPSGHTSSIFALMTVLARRSSSYWIKWASYTLASSVAFQRVMNRKHWASDVIFGGGIGYCVGSWLVHRRNGRKREKIILMPFRNGKGVGFNLNF